MVRDRNSNINDIYKKIKTEKNSMPSPNNLWTIRPKHIII